MRSLPFFVFVSSLFFLACTPKPAPVESVVKEEVKPEPSIVPPPREPAPPASKGCPPGVKNPYTKSLGFGVIHPLKNGTELWLCGTGSLEKFAGTIYLSSSSISYVSIGTFGGAAQQARPLDMQYFSLRLLNQGFTLTKLLPHRDNTTFPSFTQKYECDSAACKPKGRATCQFKKVLKKKTQKSPPYGWGMAHKKVMTFLSMKDLPVPKDWNELDETTPSFDDVLALYYDVIDKHKPSREFFLKEERLPNKIVSAYKHESPESYYAEFRRLLVELNEKGCL